MRNWMKLQSTSLAHTQLTNGVRIDCSHDRFLIARFLPPFLCLKNYSIDLRLSVVQDHMEVKIINFEKVRKSWMTKKKSRG